MKKLFILFAVLCFAVPAMAADWNFYGSSRFATFYIEADDDFTGFEDDDGDLRWQQQTNSRIGANVKFNDEIGGRFEYGAGNNINKRLLYGTYNFGAGELLIGQTYTPSSSYFYSNSVFDSDGDLLGIGQFYVGRVPMIQVKFGGFKLALVTPSQDGVGNENLDVSLPKIEASYGFKTDMFFMDVFGGYQTYELNDDDIDSYVAGIGGGVTFGPVFLNAGVHMGQNYGNYGAYNPLGMLAASYDPVTGDDSDGFGWLAVLGFNVSKMLTIEAGYGYQEYETDAPGSFTDETTQMYLNATINIAPGFFIVPEIGVLDTDDDQEKGESWYAGAKWQINF